MEPYEREEMVACHEAGHAVTAFKLNVRVVRVSIEPTPDGHPGFMEYEFPVIEEELAPYRGKAMPKALRERWKLDLMTGFGGGVAQKGFLELRRCSREHILECLNDGAMGDYHGIDLRIRRQYGNPAHARRSGERLDRFTARFGQVLIRRVAAILAEPGTWSLVERVTAALLNERTIDSEQFAIIVKGEGL